MWQRVPKKFLLKTEIQKKLCVADAKNTDDPEEKLTFYREDETAYLVPRCFDKVPPLCRLYPPPVPLGGSGDLTPVFSGILHNSEAQPQEEAVAKILETFRKAPYSGILKLPPGTGKTVIAIAAAIRFRQPTLICVHTSVLLEQWCERLRTYAGKASDVPVIPGRIRGKVFDIEGKFFVVAMLQTLYRARHVIPPETFGVVIVDEVHHVVARTYFQAVMNLPIRCVLGLSATPKRTDIPALNRILRYVMGEVIYEMVAGAIPGGTYTTTPHQAQIFIHHSESPICRKTFSNHEQARFKYLQEMTLDRIRNLGLVERLVVCLRGEPSRQVLVLSHYVDHLNTLEALFKQVWGEQQGSGVSTQALAPPTTGVVHGKVKLSARAEIFRDRQVLFSTYSLFKEGGDIPRLDTLLLTLPAGNIIQTAGRIMRSAGAASGSSGTSANPPNTKLIMAVYNDNQYPGFATFDHLRHSHIQYFRKHGFEVQQSKLVVEEATPDA